MDFLQHAKSVLKKNKQKLTTTRLWLLKQLASSTQTLTAYEIIKKSILPYKSQIQLEWNEENFKEAATTTSFTTLSSFPIKILSIWLVAIIFPSDDVFNLML